MCGTKYATPFRGRNTPYASSDFPQTGRHYDLSVTNVSRYPYTAISSTQKTPVGAYNFQQNGAYAQTPNYAAQINDSYTPLYLKQKKRTYAMAPEKNYGKERVSGLPPTESQVQGIEAIIRNEAEILAARMQGLKKKVRPIVAAS